MAKRFHTLITLALWALFLSQPAAAEGVLNALDRLVQRPGASAPREFLEPDRAFVFTHDQDASGEWVLTWEIAPEYYLYRDKFVFEALTSGLSLGQPVLPASETKDDPEFGRVEIYHEHLEIRLPLRARPATTEPVKIRVTYQGCAELGICYPPIKKEVSFIPAAASAVGAGALPPAAAATTVGQGQIAQTLATRSLPAVLASFFVFGLLLAFTPCVFPMIPILSGIIVGQRQPVGTRRNLLLSIVYVVAMAAAYAVAGLIAGLFGRNLQASFQQPLVLIAFSGLFVALAMSMFGFYELQLPVRWQTRLDRLSRSQHGGSLLGVAVMGVLSAVIVGPCVAPPLAGALVYLSHQGSPAVGGAALFALGLGMGTPLLLIGASAGRLLPRAGAWMELVKRAFGVVFLGVAIWFLERLLPGPAVLALWAVLAIASAIYLGALEPLAGAASGWQRFWKGIGLALLCYGVVLIVGAAAGADDPLQPLRPLAAAERQTSTPALTFASVKGLTGFERALAAAQAAGKPVMLDFYADWCIECKHLERQTFTDPSVRTLLANAVLLRADVTANDVDDQALLRRFELLGPPAVLMFGADGQELRAQRLQGFLGPREFYALVSTAYAE